MIYTNTNVENFSKDSVDDDGNSCSSPVDATSTQPGEDKITVNYDNQHFFNREISQLKFNLRVLEQALDSRHPLLERLKFLLIFSSNMDEFFEVRVAKLKQQIFFGRETITADGLAPRAALKLISELAHQAIEYQYHILNNVLLPELANNRIEFVRRRNWTEQQRQWIADYFENEVAPVISPIALDPAHPFPKLVNKSLNFIVSLKGKDAFGRESRLAVVPAPRALPRLIKLPQFEQAGGDGQDVDQFVFLSAVIHDNIDHFFHGMSATGCYQFRVTRNSDLGVNEEAAQDIAKEVEGKLFERRFGHAVRLEVVEDCPPSIKNFLMSEFGLQEQELYETRGPVNLKRIFALYSMVERPDLLYPEFSPELPPALGSDKNLFDAIKHKDYLLFHPYSSFNPVLDLVRQAAVDPGVVSIKQTLYRVGHDSEIVSLLAEAARQGKEVTVVVELKARFDEQENLILANRLQEAGAVVCYGVVGYKTHAKMLMILRKEQGKFVRYSHLGTGNYHAGNARMYSDYSLFTADNDICSDVHSLFQQLTGMGKTLPLKRLVSAPFKLRKTLVKLIDSEIEAAKEKKEARIIVKVNGLSDRKIIEKLYKASTAGVKIDLIVRGVCCLKPGLAGVSENITVRSTIGRFLEHTRVFYFENAESSLYCGSADLMERNLDHRIETCFPIINTKLRNRVLTDLNAYLNDEGQSWLLDKEGDYQLSDPDSKKVLVQRHFLNKHCDTAVSV